MRHVFLLLAFLAAATPAQGSPTPDTLASPEQEARARNLQKELRCLVCQGESLDESNASLAIDLRRLIRARIKAGESDAAIKKFLVSRYGDFILMQPPFEMHTYALWLAPFAVLILGAGIAAWAVGQAKRRETESCNITDS